MLKKFEILLFLLSVFVACFAKAQKQNVANETSRISLGDGSAAISPKGESNLKNSKNTDQKLSGSKSHGMIAFESTKYTSELESNSKLNQSQLLLAGLDLNYKSSGQLFNSKLDFQAGRYLDLNNSFLAVQEIFAQLNWSTSEEQNKQNFEISVGRKKENWSDIDQNWQLGLWEPKFNGDMLRPLNQGLSGLFINTNNNYFEFVAYASPIFVPTMNPDISEKNGELTSDSRWYRTPSQNGEVLDKDKKFYYSISMPQIEKLIMNPGAGAKLRIGNKDSGPWISANFARKPINSLFVQYDYNLYLNASIQSEPLVEVQPVVSYHRLFGSDIGWKFNEGQVSVSYLGDEPETEKPIDDKDEFGISVTDRIRQAPGRLKIYAAHAEQKVRAPFFVEPLVVKIDYIKADEQKTVDIDSRGDIRGAIFPYRLNFYNAASMTTVFSLRSFSRPFKLSTTALRDFDQNGNLYSIKGVWSVASNWSLSTGIDILGVDDSSDSNTDGRFLNQYRANDRVYGGLSYVF